jgi:hypothetical protein
MEKGSPSAGLSCFAFSRRNHQASIEIERIKSDEKANAVLSLTHRKPKVPLDIAVLFFRANLRFFPNLLRGKGYSSGAS